MIRTKMIQREGAWNFSILKGVESNQKGVSGILNAGCAFSAPY